MVVAVDGKPLRTRRKIYVALNKPTGLVCSRKDEHDRPTIYALLPREWDHLHSVGRLDYNALAFSRHPLLRVGPKRSRGGGLVAKALDRIHNVRLLR